MNASGSLKVGLFGIGLDAYWPQFGGFRERLETYLAQVARKLAGLQVQVIDLGLIDTPAE
jgi:L-arabinose isomerase